MSDLQPIFTATQISCGLKTNYWSSNQCKRLVNLATVIWYIMMFLVKLNSLLTTIIILVGTKILYFEKLPCIMIVCVCDEILICQ